MFQQRQLERTKEEITDRVEKSERTMEKLREAADVIRVSFIHKHESLLSFFLKMLIQDIKNA